MALLLTTVLSLLALAQLNGISANGPVQVLDSVKDKVNIEAIAKIVCQETKEDVSRQIARIDTISRLRSYFDSLPQDHNLQACKEQHYDSIRLLDLIVTVSNENVCSDEKVTLIEDYHVKYVSTASEHNSARSGAKRDLAPHKLRLFFWHYALEINAICKRNLINNLEWDLKENFPDVPELQLGDESVAGSNPVMRMFSGAAGNILKDYKFGEFDDIVTFWSLIGQSYLGKSTAEMQPEELDDMFDPATGEPVRLMVKMREVRGINAFKRVCHFKYKPIYSKLILPIVRLSDLGYANSGEQFKRELEELRENQSVRRWYEITQICDAALPVKFLQDERLRSDEVVMIAREEAQQLKEDDEHLNSANEKQLVYEPTTNTLVGVEQLDSVYSSEGVDMIKQLRTSETANSRITAKAIKRVLGNAFKALKSKVRTVFVSKKIHGDGEAGQSSSDAEDRVPIDENVTKLWENLSEEELIKMKGSQGIGKRLNQAQRGKVVGVGKRAFRRRKGDVDLVQEMRAQQLSYQHTKTWGAMFTEWFSVLKAIEPSYTSIVLIGGIVTGLIVIMSILAMSMTAAG